RRGGRQRFSSGAVDRFQSEQVLRPDLRDGAIERRRAGGALADFASQLMRQPRFFGLGHQSQGLSDALIGKQIEKRRLLQLRRERLPQRAIKNLIARGVGEVGENDRVFVGELWKAARAVIKSGGGQRSDN